MSNYNTNTVIALKSAFLKAQIRILLQPLQIPPQWSKDDRDLPLGTIEDVLRHVNRLLRQHVKAAYSALAIRHVAEQIDKLYWNAAEPSLQSDEAVDGIPRRDADLTLDETISQLPSSWTGPDISFSSDRRETQLEEFAEQSSYSTNLARLRSLAERRAALRARLGQLKKLNKMLEPFKKPQDDIQPDLVTGDGELAQELARMRALSAKVSSGLKEDQMRGHRIMEDHDVTIEETEQDWMGADEKLQEVLRMS
ncbi:MAG: hypothetical protein M1821_007317 [Bathelium mastoideum]|nr:MAG: hypothetical protein M1821_007317 [Bathelium mastoideum]KAI9694821.1 MAG: hypothetical protein M1822_000437 [Bathelium mastoideum]